MNASFTEKSVWISFFSTLGLAIYYGLSIWGLDEENAQGAARLLVKVLILSVIIQVALHSLLAASNPKGAQQGDDERDTLFAQKASHLGYWVLSVGVVLCIGRLLWVSLFPQWTESSVPVPMLNAHMLMLALIVAELCHGARLIWLYRWS